MSILLVRPGALGDTILTLPIVDAISHRRPEQTLTLLGAKQYEFLMPPHVKVESFDSIEWTWVFEEDKPCSRLSSSSVDMAYVILKNFHTPVRNLESAGIRTISASSLPEPATGIVKTLCERLSLPVPPRKPYLENFTNNKTSHHVWIAPGSGSRKKNAPISLFHDTCNLLKTIGDFEFHVTLGESDTWLLQENDFLDFVEGISAKVFYKKTLNELVANCCNSCFYIGNDSGASHLAAALNIPCILFFQTTDFRVWAPWVPMKNLFIHDSKTFYAKDIRHLERFVTQSLANLQPNLNPLKTP